MDLLRQRPEVKMVELEDNRIKVTLGDLHADPGFVAEALVHGGARLTGLEEEELGLEEVFMRVTTGETQ